MQLSLPEIIVLAVVQGLTEFLPVSSSGHLVIVARFLASDGKPHSLDINDLNIVLHAGTLVSILIVYFRRIARLLGEDRRLVGRLVIATIPAVLVGIPIKEFAEASVLANPLLAGCLLIVTGSMLLATPLIPRGKIEYRDISYGQAFFIGLSQAAAILPGLSRSGATISTGLGLGLKPASAATFSFLMAIPVIGGASFLELISLIRQSELTTPASHLIVGACVSCCVGLAALFWLIRWIERGRLQWFAAWCIPLGIAVVIWQLTS
ncbi:MAG: undecaprenyl-diphosphate phosphatase [Pirellulaceae bacterium]|jgi:undecaprenyl-diphosphatase|nr:undecaprenyl-diphosphate phosphatase [Pirellulaceae bacterium]